MQALDAALGMLYLHSLSPPILHRDLKSLNLLVVEGWHAKVGWWRGGMPTWALKYCMSLQGVVSEWWWRGGTPRCTAEQQDLFCPHTAMNF